MKQKVYCLLKTTDMAKLKGGKYDTTEKSISVRIGIREKLTITASEGVYGLPFKRGRLLFLVDAEQNATIPFGVLVYSDKDIKDKVSMYTRNKVWRFMSKRSLDTLELLINLCAGYGILRWLEYFVFTLWGGQ